MHPQDFTKGRGMVFQLRVPHEEEVSGLNITNLQQGDVVVVAQSCAAIVTSAVSMPYGPSGKVVLDSHGDASVLSLASGRLSELEEGGYKICYATAASGVDSDADFSELGGSVSVVMSMRHPSVRVPAAVSLGEDIVVRWQTTAMDEAPDVNASHGLDWIGLYRRGECAAFDQQWRHGEDADGDVVSIAEQNRCFLQVRTLSTPAACTLPHAHASFSCRLSLYH